MIITIQLDQETGFYESYCDDPPVASFGSTAQEALAMVQEAAMLYLEVAKGIDEQGG